MNGPANWIWDGHGATDSLLQTLRPAAGTLHQAVFIGDVVQVQNLLQNGEGSTTEADDRMEQLPSPDDPDEHGYSPIHYVALSNVADQTLPLTILDHLLCYYTNTSPRKDTDETDGLSEEEDSESVEIEPDLIANVLNLRDATAELNTVLHLAVKHRRASLGRRLLGRTYARVDSFLFPHELKADTLVENDAGWLPIHYASNIADNSPLDLLSNLIRVPPELNIRRYPPHVPTPVQIAALHARISALSFFLQNSYSFEAHGGHSVLGLLMSSESAAEDRDAAWMCLQFLLKAQNEGIQGLKRPDGDDSDHLALAATRLRAPRLLEQVVQLQRGWMDDVRRNESKDSSPLHVLATRSPSRSQATNEATVSAQLAASLLDLKSHRGQMSSVAELVQLSDANEKTALDLCCAHKNVELAATILLATYAHDPDPDNPLEVHYWLEKGVLSKLYRDIPLALLPVLDLAVKGKDLEHEPNLDFGLIRGIEEELTSGSAPLKPGRGNQEEEHLFQRLQAHNYDVQERLLLHPLTHAYLTHAWDRVRWPAYSAALFQFLVIGLYAWTATAWNDQTNRDVCDPLCRIPAIVTFVLAAFLLLKEAYQTNEAPRPFSHLLEPYNLAQIAFGLVAVPLAAWVALGREDSNDSNETFLWILSMVGLFLAWLVAILQLRNLPPFGVYISIFTQVTWKSLKLLVLFGLPTFVLFGQIFRILLLGGPARGRVNVTADVRQEEREGEGADDADEVEGGPFQPLDQFGTLVKLLAMFIGELTFDEMLKGLQPLSLRYYTALVVFSVFAFISTIVFLNLLVGVAVSITREVESKAAIEVAKVQLAQISFWETWQKGLRERFCSRNRQHGAPICQGRNLTAKNPNVRRRTP